jgi:hypothetical protein
MREGKGEERRGWSDKGVEPRGETERATGPTGAQDEGDLAQRGRGRGKRPRRTRLPKDHSPMTGISRPRSSCLTNKMALRSLPSTPETCGHWPHPQHTGTESNMMNAGMVHYNCRTGQTLQLLDVI